MWPPLFVVAVYVGVGRIGFFPTDEGLIQAYAYRILHGQVPHRDFVSPRPLGSALLHLVDFAIPGPLFEVSRVIALCEYVAYAMCIAWLIYSIAPLRWGIVMASGAAWSVLINMNVFPLMAWYTVDGLLLVAAGLVVVQIGVRQNSFRMIALGFAVVGAAALTKQSFVPAPAVAWLLLVPRLLPMGWKERIRDLFVTGVFAALPSLVFIGTISALGGFHALRAQLLGGAFIYGRPLLAQWSPRHDLLALGLLVGATAILAVAIDSARLKREARIGSRALLSILIVGVPMASRLGASGAEWGDRLFWMAVAIWSVRMVARRNWDGTGLAVIACAWMSSLSYGFPYPSFVGGGLALYVLHRTWADAAMPDELLPRALPVVAALAVFAVVASVFMTSRLGNVYMDLPAGGLTANLGGVSGSFGDIRTNPHTADYLSQMKACVEQHPARHVAILPENAAMYPALNLDNPFPIDWIWPDDIHGSESAILSTVAGLNSSGDYLVLFQTVDEPQVVTGALTPATADSKIAAYTPIVDEIYAGLNGTHTTCGTFLVVYAPPAS